MNQNSVSVKLRDFTTSERPFGNDQGKAVYQRLLALFETNPDQKIYGISLEGIEATDASFPRESVISLAKQFRGQRGLYLLDFHDRDLIDNWHYAAQAKNQPVVIWDASDFEIVGPELNPSTRSLVAYVLTNRSVFASQAAADLGLSVQNASTRLKKLVADGYILRTEDIAESGGIEFKYQAIR